MAEKAGDVVIEGLKEIYGNNVNNGTELEFNEPTVEIDGERVDASLNIIYGV